MNADHASPPPPPPDSHLVQPARIGVSADILAIENLFLDLTNEAARAQLIREAGATLESRIAFETKRGLPPGAVELVLLTADKEFADKTRGAGQKLMASKKTKEDIDEYVFESLAISAEMSKAYPQAFAILSKYADDRNHQFVLAMRDTFERNRHRINYEITEAVLPIDALAVINLGLLVNVAVATNAAGAVKIAIQAFIATNAGVAVTTSVKTVVDA